jgi:uroporphyrinogen-III synthase
MINFASTENAAELAAVFSRLEQGEFDWLVVTSATTVDVLTSHEVRVPARTRIAAVGETTGGALSLAGYSVDFVPEYDNSPRGLVREWEEAGLAGRLLVPRSDDPDGGFEPELRRLGLEVESVIAYRTVGVAVPAEVVAEVASGGIGGILVTSGSVARQIRRQLAPLPEGTIVAAIGPRTAFDAREEGIPVHVIAESRTAESLVAALVDYARSSAGG